MLVVTCIQKYRDKDNDIFGYSLQDNSGCIRDFYADQVKEAIRNNQITVTNLKLTSDNRLVDKKSNQSQQGKLSNAQLQNLITKARALGLSTELPTSCGHKFYLIQKSETQLIIYIPDNVTRVLDIDHDRIDKKFGTFNGHIKVIGGNGLIDANALFEDCQAQSIDLSQLNTNNVLYMHYMFSNCSARSINFSSFNTNKVVDMHCMFSSCSTPYLDLSSFNTRRVENMYSMFSCSSIRVLNLKSFNTSSVEDMGEMFSYCNIPYIDLSSFDISRVKRFEYMFECCKADTINLSSFNITDKIMNDRLDTMFNSCESNIISTNKYIREAFEFGTHGI